MTNKVEITNPVTRQFDIIYRQCPSSSTSNEVKFYGDITNIIQSTNSPRKNRRLSLRQNSLTVLKIRKPAAPYPVNWSGVTACTSSGVTFCNSYLTVDPSFVKVAPGLPGINEDDSYRIAVQNWYDEIGSVKLNIAQIFVERQQTVDLISNTALRLVDAYRDIRRGRNPFGGKKPTSRRSADAWLEYTYGWVPLLQDIYDATELGDLKPPTFVVRKTSRRPHTDIRKGVPKSSQTLDSFESFSTESRSKMLRTTVRGRVTVNNTALSFASRVGLTNPALLTWEILPYSFVVDWFYPIGPWLERQSALSGITVTDASVTRTARFYGMSSVTTSVKRPLMGSLHGGGGGQNSMTQVNKQRSLGIPRLPPPRLRSPISVSHAISALALLRQVFH